MEFAIETRGLRRTFGDFVAVDGVDLQVPLGCFYGFLGPNGAGKSTTLKCLTGLLRPSAGSISILGLSPETESLAIRQRMGVMPEDLALFDRLTGRETLSFVGQVYGLDGKALRARSDELLALMDLESAADALVVDYSHGMRKKISLAAALLPAPRLLFLDEPFEGIDAITSHQIKEILTQFVRGGGTVFLTSHILELVERMADHLGVIHKGKLVAQGPLAELRAGSGNGKTLEQIFLDLVGASGAATHSLAWLSA
jgi:ABC-2 type transport system ATP-binding protein